MIEDLALPALRRVELQLDGRHRRRRDDHSFDLRRLESTLDKAATQRAVRIAEHWRALDPDGTVFGKQDLYVETGDGIGSGAVVVHYCIPCTRPRHRDIAVEPRSIGGPPSPCSAVDQLLHGFSPAVTKAAHDRIFLRKRLGDEHRCVNQPIG